ncbi:MAG: dihydrolipoyl dehydrogenase [Prevotella sp.]|nr:dihydrolipoyl dehydrogenase [Prevotella sp.]
MKELIIIGSGPGGYRTAAYAASKGIHTTIFEDKEAGGTCLNCGCIPTKTLCHEAEIADILKNKGIDSVDFSAIMARKNAVIEQLRSGVETVLQGENISFVKAHAAFKDEKTVVADGQEYTADKFIIATGSHAKMLPIEGIDQSNVMTSTELLNITEVPKRLCIVGAGVIGMEMASVFNSLGSEVTVIEFLKECLPMVDSDIAKRLRQTIAKRGVTFFMQSGVKRINGNTVFFERKGKEEQVEADIILIATGRGANVEGLGLENTGVNFSPKGIEVDGNMQTNIPHIYAIGDVNARMMLAHAATFQGLRAVNHMLGIEDEINLDIMPAAIFTKPEAACVGLSEDQCKENGMTINCKKGFYRANGKALAMDETDGLLKLITDEKGLILGCHVFGAHAAEIVQEVSVLMCKQTHVHELAQMVHIHPTLSEILSDTAMMFYDEH